MDKFPQEIISAILSHIEQDEDSDAEDQPQIRRYATISRQWQYAVERITLDNIEVESTELSTFANLFRPSQNHRRTLVKAIFYNVLLPAYSDEACCEYENEDEKEANNQAFSNAISGLFNVLESLDDDEVRKAGGLILCLNSYSPMDTNKLPAYKRKIREARLGDRKDLWEKRYRASFLQLKNPEWLPVLSNISEFVCREGYHSRNIEPASGFAIAAKFKHLERCTLEFCDKGHISTEVRRRNRNKFAEAISTSTQQSVDIIKIQLVSDGPTDEGSTPPRLLTSSSPVDSLNVSIHNFIQQANVGKILLFDHIVAPELFWPFSPNTTAISSPFWKSLRQIQVNMQACTPDGDWYFMVDPNIASYAEFTTDTGNANSDVEEDTYDSDEESDSDIEAENTFRSIPDPKRMNPLLIAMARAVQHASSLERMWVNIPGPDLSPKYVRKDVTRIFEVYYVAEGVDDNCDETPNDKTRLIWQVGDWRPDEEVEKEWRKAISPDGVVLYNVPDY
ncbi:hypothetical protein AJ79_02529 [Helicocarpus griseus UAMH5409]|uniref:F-box domain-containing protein n=1 Tax=Helicocarpus griseus UAMH5409 TaxID=1447875 RepID=A0A2B7XTS0_9EURO|nr:hypothetical protein AJ79_02529 [Helicocarpus griseus UAMH5409]